MKKTLLILAITLTLSACATTPHGRGAQFRAAFVSGQATESAISQEANWADSFGDPHIGFYHNG